MKRVDRVREKLIRQKVDINEIQFDLCQGVELQIKFLS